MKKVVFAAGLLLWFLVLPAAAGKPAVILKKNDIDVSKKKIYLGDVAAFRNISGKDAEKLGKLYLKRAAVPGRSVRITKNLVRNKVKKKFRYISVQGKKLVKVHTKKKVISREKIEEKAREYIKKNMPWKEGQAKIRIKPIRRDVEVLNGKVLLKAKRGGSLDFKGSLIVPVEIFIDNKFYRIVPVTAVVSVKAGCLAALRDIRRREKVDGAMVKEVDMDITRISGRVIISVESIKGSITKRGIPAGTILRESMFEKPPLFRWGDEVEVIVFVNGVAVKSRGKALAEGRAGSKVKVKLITGKKVIGTVNKYGKVIIVKK